MREIELWLITNRDLVESDEEYFYKIEEAMKNSVKNIIFREKNYSLEKQEFYYGKIKELGEKYNCEIIINSNVELAEKFKEKAIHLTYKDFIEKRAELNFEKIGVSIHSVEEGKKANDLGANYILASNIYETDCKKGLKGKGIKFLEELKLIFHSKIIALGGINESNVKELSAIGINSIAVMSFIMKSNNVKKQIKKLKENKN
ncbi:MAG: thiamine phosphate synthase [Sarcina sp.]